MNEKIGYLSRETEIIKKQPNGKFRTEIFYNQIKIFLDSLNSEWR